MSSDPPRGFSDDTNATPLHRLSDSAAVGPRRPCLVMVAGPLLGEIFPIEGELIIGRDPDAQLRLADDESVSRRHAAVRKLESGAMVVDLGSSNGTYVDGTRVSEQQLKEGSKIRVGQTVVFKYAEYDQLEETAQRQLLDAALRDGLTKSFNRRYFVQRLTAELRFAARHDQQVALLMLDVDHFKRLNDTYGHPAGDEVLKGLVDLLGKSLRAEDVLARYGGEEFAILARNISHEHARLMADRLRKAVEGAPFSSAGHPLNVTVSVGLAMFPYADRRDVDGDKLIALADEALYRAKQAGRNTIDG